MRRDRSVIFRLSDQEYDRVVLAAGRDQARSVSEFIREAVMARADGPTLEARVEALEAAVLPRPMPARSFNPGLAINARLNRRRRSASGD